MVDSDIICVHVFITGTVQGVGYRYATVREAQKHLIKGWVRNLRDGRVEAIFEGREPLVNQMVQWCHHGPRNAEVTDVAVESIEIQGCQGFDVEETQ